MHHTLTKRRKQFFGLFFFLGGCVCGTQGTLVNFFPPVNCTNVQILPAARVLPISTRTLKPVRQSQSTNPGLCVVEFGLPDSAKEAQQ